MGIAKLTEDLGPDSHIYRFVKILIDYGMEYPDEILAYLVASYLIDDCLLEPKLGKVTKETVETQVTALINTHFKRLFPENQIYEHSFHLTVWSSICEYIRLYHPKTLESGKVLGSAPGMQRPPIGPPS